MWSENKRDQETAWIDLKIFKRIRRFSFLEKIMKEILPAILTETAKNGGISSMPQPQPDSRGRGVS